MNNRTVVDVAGGRVGGAARFLDEYRSYLSHSSPPKTIGWNSRLSPQWLIKREFSAISASHTVAINNASFLGGKERSVLLRNALHFPWADEFDRLGFRPGPGLLTQTSVIHLLTRRATRAVVPCSAMKDRVVAHLPGLADNVVVRPHPVTPPTEITNEAPERAPLILVPIVNQAYKNLNNHLMRLLKASPRDARVVVTGSSIDYSTEVASDGRVEFVGILSPARLRNHWDHCHGVYYPTQTEAFGYPLAEARACGRPVLAPDTSQNREIAGQALMPYLDNDDSFAQAVTACIKTQVQPDPGPFAPDAYFDWLLESPKPQPYERK